MLASSQSLKVPSMHRPFPPKGSAHGANGQGSYRRGLELAPSNGPRDDKRLEKVLGRRLCNSYAVPGQEDEQIRSLLRELAAKLRETPPE
jgi:hypothetical protein